MKLRRAIPFTAITLALLGANPSGDAPPIYSNDFSEIPPGKLEDEQFLSLAGIFTVEEVGGNRLLELTGTTLDSLGLLFGPTPEKATGTVTARIWAASTGKRVPEFGVGSNDAGGYKLWLMPRQKVVAIRKGDATVAKAAYDGWKTETWTQFRLEVANAGEGKWIVRGRVWADGTDEPKDWTVSFDETEEPAAGRASVWANPYSNQPTRFDDLKVLP
jgi:hypothetical protein